MLQHTLQHITKKPICTKVLSAFYYIQKSETITFMNKYSSLNNVNTDVKLTYVGLNV